MLKPFLLKAQQVQPMKEQLKSFKYNTELFNLMMADQPKYAMPDESWSIVLGNVEANNIITMVTNPYCPPCARAHKLLDELTEQKGNIQARIVFSALNREDDEKTPVARHMMALYGNENKNLLRQAMHDWYDEKQKNFEVWAKKYPIDTDESQFYKLDKQRDWCDLIGLTATPTLLLNGRVLPSIYKLSDLKYMVE
jgi:protein-disulfide isomerase